MHALVYCCRSVACNLLAVEACHGCLIRVDEEVKSRDTCTDCQRLC